jgi:hypothetical protein
MYQNPVIYEKFRLSPDIVVVVFHRPQAFVCGDQGTARAIGE